MNKGSKIIAALLLISLLPLGCKGPAKKGAAPKPKSKEEIVVDYIVQMSQMSVDDAQYKMECFFKKYESDTAMTATMKRYVYDPNSPYRNEDWYLPLAKGLAASEFTPDSLREAYRTDIRKCSLNRYGTVAADFKFRTLQGKTYKLSQIPGDFTMLFFSNPGCTACKGIIEEVESMEPVHDAIEDGRISVVNVYIDEDLKAWKEYAVNYPKSWYSGYDPSLKLRDDTIYSIRAIPSLYLLDKDKKVIMKDAPTERVLMYLVNELQ